MRHYDGLQRFRDSTSPAGVWSSHRPYRQAGSLNNMHDPFEEVHSICDAFTALPTDATILVADDHAENRDLFQEVLATAGFHVVVAEDGAAALRKFKYSKPDVKGGGKLGQQGGAKLGQ